MDWNVVLEKVIANLATILAVIIMIGFVQLITKIVIIYRRYKDGIEERKNNPQYAQYKSFLEYLKWNW